MVITLSSTPGTYPCCVLGDGSISCGGGMIVGAAIPIWFRFDADHISIRHAAVIDAIIRSFVWLSAIIWWALA